MRSVILLIVIFGLISFAAAAQEYPRVEFFGGYQFTHPEINGNANGWATSITANFTNRIGGVADFSGTYNSRQNTYTVLFGPVFALRGSERVTPFAHLLVGSNYLEANRSTTGLTMAIGGGLDAQVKKELAVRLVQVDWLPMYVGPNWMNRNVRASAGLVFRF